MYANLKFSEQSVAIKAVMMFIDTKPKTTINEWINCFIEKNDNIKDNEKLVFLYLKKTSSPFQE